MKTQGDYKPSQTFGLLLVGEPKTGKSRIALSFPDPYIQDWDRNLTAAVNVEPGKKFWFDDPYSNDDGSPIPDKDLWPKNMDRLKAALVNPEIKTIVLDSLSTLSSALTYHIAATTTQMEGRAAPRDNSELLVEGNVRPGEKGIIGGLLRLQDYQIFQTMMVRTVAHMRKFPKLIVWTAHQKIRENALNNIKTFRLNMPGSLADNFGGFYSDVWGTHAEPGDPTKYILTCAPSIRHTDLGTSIGMPARVDITGKTPSQIWDLIAPKVTQAQKVLGAK